MVNEQFRKLEFGSYVLRDIYANTSAAKNPNTYLSLSKLNIPKPYPIIYKSDIFFMSKNELSNCNIYVNWILHTYLLSNAVFACRVLAEKKAIL